MMRSDNDLLQKIVFGAIEIKMMLQRSNFATLGEAVY